MSPARRNTLQRMLQHQKTLARVAVDLARASDRVRLLQQCEAATGRTYVTDEDLNDVKHLSRDFASGVWGGPTGVDRRRRPLPTNPTTKRR